MIPFCRIGYFGKYFLISWFLDWLVCSNFCDMRIVNNTLIIPSLNIFSSYLSLKFVIRECLPFFPFVVVKH